MRTVWRRGVSFFLMEYVNGLSLRQLLDAGTVSRRRHWPSCRRSATPYSTPTTAASCTAISSPRTSCSIAQGQVKIADFGLAKLVGRPPRARVADRQAGRNVGTPQYMAPEQIETGTVDHRADIYSLGVVFYQMLTGELPKGRFRAAQPRYSSTCGWTRSSSGAGERTVPPLPAGQRH